MRWYHWVYTSHTEDERYSDQVESQTTIVLTTFRQQKKHFHSLLAILSWITRVFFDWFIETSNCVKVDQNAQILDQGSSKFVNWFQSYVNLKKKSFYRRYFFFIILPLLDTLSKSSSSFSLIHICTWNFLKVGNKINFSSPKNRNFWTIFNIFFFFYEIPTVWSV